LFPKTGSRVRDSVIRFAPQNLESKNWARDDDGRKAAKLCCVIIPRVICFSGWLVRRTLIATTAKSKRGYHCVLGRRTNLLLQASPKHKTATMEGSDQKLTTLLVTHTKQLVYPTSPSVSLSVGKDGDEEDSRQDDRVRELDAGDDSMDMPNIEREIHGPLTSCTNPCLRLEDKEAEAKVRLAPRFRRAHLNELRSSDKLPSSLMDRVIMTPDQAARTMSFDDESSRLSDDDASPREVNNSRAKEFCRLFNCPSIPLLAAESIKNTGFTSFDANNMPRLRRCNAWSQDSMDQQYEQRAKRRREDEPTTIPYAFPTGSVEGTSQVPAAPHRLIGISTLRQRYGKKERLDEDNLTFIHWEEQVVDSEQIFSFMQRGLNAQKEN
jgi:hypothetical protein